jgi:hypothetical protein
MRELAALTLIVWECEDRFLPVAQGERAAQAMRNAQPRVRRANSEHHMEDERLP